MLDTTKKTVGAAALELKAQGDQKQSVVETQQAMQKGYVDELIKAAKAGEELYGKEKHFYICVQTKRERLLDNVIRNIFYPRQTRPIPQYDLALYFYDPRDEKLQFVWVIPDKETVDHFAGYWQNLDGKRKWVAGAVPQLGEEDLCRFCRWFRAGELI